MTANRRGKALLGLLLGLALVANAEAARESKVSQTKHNLSSSQTISGATKSTTESQICVFCHTPHAADATVVPVLWNKSIVAKTYTLYTSSSLDATQISGRSAEQPMGSSKLCLSCHDGAMALGSVRVLRGQKDQIIGGGTQVTMPGSTTSGFTRNLGGASNLDLSNDHPISVTYDTTLAARDGELRNNNGPSQSWGTVLGKRVKGGTKYVLPLEATGSIVGTEGQVQCTTCHDPHIRDNNTAEGNVKFLRGNRFQKAQPTASYSAANDIICLACHDKGMMGNGNSYAYSAHANQQVTDSITYSDAASNTREFPLNAVGNSIYGSNIKVWQASCLNCHDTHTITGANKLLREGASSGAAALEQTCYQCHSTTGATTLNSNATVPDLATAFGLTYRMPIVTADQGTTSAPSAEVHAIGNNFNNTYVDCSSVSNKCGADGVEDRALLGTTAANRHVECADCHNPHRVVKFQKFYGAAGNITGTPDSSGHHTHTDTAMLHTNVASGVLRGTTGVEPSYPNNSFHSSANNYTVRRGDPSDDYVPNTSATDTKTYVTREYQVCLKCHSSYGYNNPPALRVTSLRGLTASGTNGLTDYTDQAKEFQAPTGHQNGTGDGTTMDLGTDGGAHSSYNANNHRSWHPVMAKTGRTYAKRNISKNPGGTVPATYPWRSPWSPNASVGEQTMYCSDCHGSNTGATTTIPSVTTPPTPWGPHGSENPFLLKGVWTKDVGKSGTGNGLCFKCHNYGTYAQGKTYPNSDGCNSDTKKRMTGFGNSTEDLHCKHNELVSRDLQCSWCHIAIPHGWKNKMFLVNLNDVGAEVGKAAGSIVSIGGNGNYYTKSPYYLNAKLKVRTFAKSGSWSEGDCGNNGTQTINSTTDPGSGASAGGSNETSTGKSWMTNTCGPPSN